MDKLSRKLEDAYSAKEIAKRRYGKVKGLNGIGVARRGADYAVKLNFAHSPEIDIPKKISGVNVIVDVVGKIRSLRDTRSQSTFHVVPHKGRWAVRRPNAERVSSTHATQQDAIGAARIRAKRKHGDLIVHGRDGAIRNRDSYRRP
jgi:hypothetical protein